ncbi:MAG: bifunctional UDP-N-acetylmuramoyl-tripeptide:D-alanyl-D-alanine ligase/alanine racemase [Bacteroidetes bacterium]|nr:bifunctional UDP-N-acetylmuramoyl-tripeptide:D-alanyl-D-alanine ligase/alanine racemase [Bacteroidota bacterium]
MIKVDRRTYNIEDIGKMLDGEAHLNSPEMEIETILLDSRSALLNETSLFFAIRGERWNGHHFIKELYEKGIRNFVVDEELPTTDYRQANFIKVDDTLRALQELGKQHRARFDIPVLGITGSNGKTVIKEWLFQIMREKYHIVRSPKSFNSQIGVPLSVWQMNEFHEFGIFEAGISTTGEMEKIEAVLKPNLGIFTNIGSAHDQGFANREEKIQEKLILFKGVDKLIYCKDYKDIDEAISSFKFDSETVKIISWSGKEKADIIIKSSRQQDHRTTITINYNNSDHEFEVPFTDKASIENACHCICFLLSIDFDVKEISRRSSILASVAMRLEMKEGKNNCSLINDSYNSDIGSLNIALDFLNQQHQHRTKTLIISDILQSGKQSEALYLEVGKLLENKGIDKMIGIGEAISTQKDVFENKGIETSFYESTAAFLEHLNEFSFKDETILLKGARAFEFEKISKLLEKKAHKTVLEINLNALADNLNFYRSLLKPETKIMAMVKAFSYGGGSFEIANTLQFNRVDYIAVAYADEGAELRRSGIHLPIVVMSPEEQSFDSLIALDLEPVIYTEQLLKSFHKALINSLGGPKTNYPVHIKLETGMHRLGFNSEEITGLLTYLTGQEELQVKSVFSHLAAGETPEQDDFTHSQFESFQSSMSLFKTELGYPVLGHILNSAGIVRFPDFQFEMVRIGIGLYGIDTSGTHNDRLKNVSRLKTTITQIKTVKKGESVGYGRKAMIEKEMKVGVIGIGYADGFKRQLGNGLGEVYVNGHITRIIGNICMDMSMIDLTNVEAQEGDEVLIFGEEMPIQAIAAKLETIPYEILSTISRRVKRVYYYE